MEKNFFMWIKEEKTVEKSSEFVKNFKKLHKTKKEKALYVKVFL